MKRLLIGAAALLLVAAPVLASPEFPPLTGRVVDKANVIPAPIEQALTQRLEKLETDTGRQLVVATFPTLQGYEIEDFGYQLGRRWGIGSKDDDDGALFIVAPNDRKVRIEVGYGLEPVLTDALSSTILQTAVIPKFKAGDMSGGIVAGADAIIDQLALPQAEAEQRAFQAAEKPKRGGVSPWEFAPIFPILFFFFLFMVLRGIGRRRRSPLGVLPWLIYGAMSNSSNRDWWSGGGGGGGWSGGGGGGFSGGGGSFGGGGSSGSW